MIVAFEGTDAVGKHTQSKLLAERLGCEVLSFPNYETETGKVILGHLKGDWRAIVETMASVPYEKNLNALVLQSLMTVNRYEIARKIGYTTSDKNLVLDRYYVSGVVYGVEDGLDEDWLWRIHECLPEPDRWILLDAPVEVGFERRPNRLDRYEKDRLMLERVRRRYLEIFERRDWAIVDARGSVEEVHASVRRELGL